MENDPVLSPDEAPAPKFSFFQVVTTGIIVLMAATTGISWYFIRKRQVQEEAVPSKPVLEQPKEKVDRIAVLEKKIARMEELLAGIQTNIKTSSTVPRAPDIHVAPPSRPTDRKGQAQIEEAHRSFAEGKYEKAENGYFRAIFLYPNNSDAYVGLALSALVRGAYTEAWSFLAKILRQNPDFLKEARSPLLYFGSEEERQEFLSQLAAHLEENPLDAEAKLLKAWIDIYEKGGNYGKALASELPGNLDAEILIQHIDGSGK